MEVKDAKSAKEYAESWRRESPTRAAKYMQYAIEGLEKTILIMRSYPRIYSPSTVRSRRAAIRILRVYRDTYRKAAAK